MYGAFLFKLNTISVIVEYIMIKNLYLLVTLNNSGKHIKTISRI